jgi:hypothetical protein
MDLMIRVRNMVYGKNIMIMETYGIRKIMSMEKDMGYVSVIIPMEIYLGGLIMLMEINVG